MEQAETQSVNFRLINRKLKLFQKISSLSSNEIFIFSVLFVEEGSKEWSMYSALRLETLGAGDFGVL